MSVKRTHETMDTHKNLLKTPRIMSPDSKTLLTPKYLKQVNGRVLSMYLALPLSRSKTPPNGGSPPAPLVRLARACGSVGEPRAPRAHYRVTDGQEISKKRRGVVSSLHFAFDVIKINARLWPHLSRDVPHRYWRTRLPWARGIGTEGGCSHSRQTNPIRRITKPFNKNTTAQGTVSSSRTHPPSTPLPPASPLSSQPNPPILLRAGSTKPGLRLVRG